AKPGANVSLSLAGTIVAASGRGLELKTSTVQANTSQPVAVTRKVVLGIAGDAYVSGDLGFPLGLDALLSGLPATVSTLPVRATLAAQRGDANVLTAERISLG